MLTQLDALSAVLPFASTDEARPHLARPAVYASHVVATDGHTMGVCRYDGTRQDDARAHVEGRDGNAPPWEMCVPKTLTHIGELALDSRIAHMPARWQVNVAFRPDGTATLSAHIPARTGKHGKVLASAVTVIGSDALPGFEDVHPAEVTGVDGGYLERAVALVGMGVFRGVSLYSTGPLDPIVVAPAEGVCDSLESLLKCSRFAIVMPMRI